MEKALFSVSCTTCRARLAVRNKEAIGEILECPKCGSMVLISPPEGWVLTEEPPACRPPRTSAGRQSRRPLRRTGILPSVVGVPPVARETASEKPAVRTAARSASRHCAAAPIASCHGGRCLLRPRQCDRSACRRRQQPCGRRPRRCRRLCRRALRLSSCRKLLPARRS